MPGRPNRLPLLIITGIAAALILRVVRESILRQNRDFFAGKVVILTGASRGIGRALAYALAVRGAHLVLASRGVDQLEAVAERCRSLHLDIEVMVVPTDVANPAQLEALAGAALERFGRVDILINNAGIIQGGSFESFSAEQIDRHVEVNLMSAVRLTQMVLRPMIKQGRGSIVLMCSASGRHTVPYFIPYGMTKHAMVGFGEGLRRELAGTGVRILTVNPTFVATEMADSVGPVARRIGISTTTPEIVARKTLEGIVLGVPEVNIGWFEQFGGYTSALFPFLTDLYWRLLMPREFPAAAEAQRTE